MMSLRTRLLAGVLVMTAVGLLAAGGGTYLALRSFLLGRVDQQVMATRASVGRGLRRSRTSTIDTTTLDRLPAVAFVEVLAVRGRFSPFITQLVERIGPCPAPAAMLHLPRTGHVRVPSREPALQFDAAAVRGTGRYRVLATRCRRLGCVDRRGLSG